MESSNRKILCSTGKTHEWGFETGKDISMTEKLLSQPEKNNPKPKKGIHEIGKLLP